MSNKVEDLEQRVEELYDMIFHLMEYVDFHGDYEEETKMKMPPPPRLTSIK
tara:strand:+ start:255 stop:407 length:153 start_codon:yes stop_codon:yes gene_type:complete